MIGLLDYDAIASQKIQYPNLELMKMATYLRRNGQSSYIILNLDDLEVYSKIIVFQNNALLGYPTQVFGRKNVEWYGLAFTGNKYKAMAPEIEECEPHIGIYKLLFRQFLLEDKMTTQQIGYWLNASYLRLSMPLNKKYTRTLKPRRRVLVYDTDAFSGEWEKNLEILLKRDVLGLNFLYEQNLTDIHTWARILLKYEKRIFHYNPITLTFDFHLKDMPTILEVSKKFTGKVTNTNYCFHLCPIILPPYKENTVRFAQAIGLQMREGIRIAWQIPPYTGNPFHPFINALCIWARRIYFFQESFLDFLLENDLHKERRFALKLIRQDKKFSLIFNYRTEDIKAMQGGLKSYDSRRNHQSIYSDFI